jgi:hypothetical protein
MKLCRIVGLILILILVTLSFSMSAQPLPSGDVRNPTFRTHWLNIVSNNPQIKNFSRMPDGTSYRLTDGSIDTLEHKDVNGIWGREFEKMYGISYHDFLAGKPVKATPTKQPVVKAAVTTPIVVEVIPTWAKVFMWITGIIAALVAALIVWIYLDNASFKKESAASAAAITLADKEAEAQAERDLNLDPVTSGPAMYIGGVNDTNVAHAFQVQAWRQYRRDTKRYQAQMQMFTVLEVISGRGWGVMDVLYGDGRAVARRLNGQRVYKARVLFPDGVTEELYMLKDCGNDLRYEGIHRYMAGEEFRFEADTLQPPALMNHSAVPARYEMEPPTLVIISIDTYLEMDFYGHIEEQRDVTIDVIYFW